LTDDPLSAVRQAYAATVCAKGGCADPRVVAAFAAMPREAYSPPGPWQVYRPSQAPPYFDYERTPSAEARELYGDLSVELAPGSFINAGLPSVIASWMADTAPPAGGSVVQVGAGLGYYTAILAALVGPSGRVLAAEIDPSIGRQAKRNLAHLPQVELVVGDGAALSVAAADLVLVHAGISDLPPAWLRGLSPRGALVVSLTFTDQGFTTIGLGVTLKVRPSGRDRYAARFISMPYITTSSSLRSERGEAELRRAMEGAFDYSDIASIRLDAHARDGSCWLHRDGWCVSRRPVETAPSAAGR
jgi:protein-L-isoaspartate(D-aspartate) O-methyltransferase